MPFRLIIAFALSLAFHGSLLLPELIKRVSVAPPRPALQASLRLPPMPAPLPAEPLPKDTITTASEETIPVEEPPPPKKPSAKDTLKRDVQIAQKLISKALRYPHEAVMQNIEGDVHLIVKFSANGTVDDAIVATSSGYPILDNAAIKAAYALPPSSITSRELILPVIFRLE